MEENVPEVSETPLEEPEQLTPEEIAAAIAERDQLQSEAAELRDLLLRRQAEFENYRRRTDRDKSDFLQYMGMEIVREILPIVDDFDRAMKVATTDAEYRKGIELIYQRLLDTLKKIGLEPIDIAPGSAFDPNIHQAVARVETGDAEDNTVIDEFQRGYNFKGKMLRPAMVRVAVKPAS